MPNFGPHIFAGAIVAMAYVFLLMHYSVERSLPQIGLAVIVMLVYSVFPDIDQAGSSARKLIFGFICVAICAAAWYELKWVIIGLALFMLLVMWFTEHRGLWHSIVTGLLLCVPFIWIDKLLAAMALLSFASHLMLDRTTGRNRFPY